MMKIIFKTLSALVVTFAVVLPLMVVPATAASKGQAIVMVDKCTIDFTASVAWRGVKKGGSVDMWRQVVAMRNSLPRECWKRCNFTNIDYDHFWLRMVNRRFVPATVVPDELFYQFRRQCAINVNPPPVFVVAGEPSGEGTLCTSGNSFTLTINGSGNSVSGSQSGCNSVTITINGNGNRIYIYQDGQSVATLRFDGDNSNFSLSQSGSHTYSGHFTGGTNGVVIQ